VVIVARPPTTLLPFFQAAKAVYSANTSDLSLYVKELAEVGFKNIKIHTSGYKFKLALNKWVRMLRGRFWSTLHSFTDEEMERGVKEVVREWSVDRVEGDDWGEREMEVEDVVCFITAEKG
jgi:hypothetical protein